MNPTARRLIVAGAVLGGISLFAINNYLIESRFGVGMQGLDSLINSLQDFQRRNEMCRENHSASFHLSEGKDFWDVKIYDPDGLRVVDISNQERNVKIYRGEYLENNPPPLDMVRISDEDFIQHGELYLDIVDGCGRLEGYILRPIVVPVNPQEGVLIQKT